MRKFDFVIVPIARAGGTALYRFLALHPDVFAVPKGNLDQVLAAHGEHELLEHFQPFMNKYPRMKFGLVQHTNVGRPEAIERIASVANTDNLIFVVREPFETFRSMINHVVIQWYCRYEFAGAGLPWLDGVRIDEDPQAVLAAARNGANGSLKDPEKCASNLSPSGVLRSQYRVFKNHEIIQSYLEHFQRYEVLDFSLLFGGRNGGHGLDRLFAHLGVDPAYQHPAFDANQAGTVMRFMTHNPVTVITPYEQSLEIRPMFSTFVRYAVETDLIEIASLDAASARAATGIDDGISLVSRPNDWFPINKKLRVATQIHLERFLEDVLYPLWTENYGAVMEALKPYRGSILAEDSKREMMEYVGADLREFLGRHPAFATLWPEAAGYV